MSTTLTVMATLIDTHEITVSTVSIGHLLMPRKCCTKLTITAKHAGNATLKQPEQPASCGAVLYKKHQS